MHNDRADVLLAAATVVGVCVSVCDCAKCKHSVASSQQLLPLRI